MREKPTAATTWASLSDWQQPTDKIAFVAPAMEHWQEWEKAQWVHHEGSIRRPIAPWANTLTTELHLTPVTKWRKEMFYLMTHSTHFLNAMRYLVSCCWWSSAARRRCARPPGVCCPRRSGSPSVWGQSARTAAPTRYRPAVTQVVHTRLISHSNTGSTHTCNISQ